MVLHPYLGAFPKTGVFNSPVIKGGGLQTPANTVCVTPSRASDKGAQIIWGKCSHHPCGGGFVQDAVHDRSLMFMLGEAMSFWNVKHTSLREFALSHTAEEVQ